MYIEYLQAFKKRAKDMKRDVKISGVHVYSLKGGGFAIEAKINGVKSGPERLTKEDVMSLTDKTDRKKLAEKYLIRDGK